MREKAKMTTNNHLKKTGILKKSAPAIFSRLFTLGVTKGQTPETTEKVSILETNPVVVKWKCGYLCKSWWPSWFHSGASDSLSSHPEDPKK